jgi:hypothetical protein
MFGYGERCVLQSDQRGRDGEPKLGGDLELHRLVLRDHRRSWVWDVQGRQRRKKTGQPVPRLGGRELAGLFREVPISPRARPAPVHRPDSREAQVAGAGRQRTVPFFSASADAGREEQIVPDLRGVRPDDRDAALIQRADNQIGSHIINAGDHQDGKVCH